MSTILQVDGLLGKMTGTEYGGQVILTEIIRRLRAKPSAVFSFCERCDNDAIGKFG
jgi:hypothetical protein